MEGRIKAGLGLLYIGNFRPSFSTETHVAQSLEALGCRVVRAQEDATTRAQLTALTREVDVLLYTRTWTLPGPDPIGWLRSLPVPTVSYHLDLYAGLARGRDLSRDPLWHTRHVFTADGGSAAFFRDRGINHHYLKAGVLADECYRAEPTERFRAQVGFVGSYDYHPEWPYRRRLIDFLRASYGSAFIKHGQPETSIRGHELNQLYASVKVIVGDSLCVGFDHPYYWSDRVYETLGRGGFLIHPYVFGLEEELVDRQHIVYYRFGDFAGLRRLIDYYLVHDDERETIRAAGHERVKERATYRERMRQLLATLAEHEPSLLERT